MIAAAQTIPSQTASGGWAGVRDDADLQFAPVEIPDIPSRAPTWFERLLETVFGWLGELVAPLGRLLGASWWWLQWVLLAAVMAFAAVLAWRVLSSRGRRQPAGRADAEGLALPRAVTLALLEDADALAAQGRFDEATHLLLVRSIDHIAAARPDLIEPSSTARELALLPALPDAARGAFRIMADRVERSLFALRSLDRGDWETARAAYAEFALARIGGAPPV